MHKTRKRLAWLIAELLIDPKWLPKHVFTTTAKGMPLWLEDKRTALVSDNTYISINNTDSNGSRIYNAMIFDVDRGDAVAAWKQAELPFLPRYMCGTRSGNGLSRAHVVIQLSDPVHVSHTRALKLYAVIYNEIVRRLEAAGAFVDCGKNRGTVSAAKAGQKTIVKNPASKAWTTFPGDQRSWTLYELAEKLDIDPVTRSGRDATWTPGRKSADFSQNLGLGRNCDMFETVRFQVYAEKRYCSSESELIAFAHQQCVLFNESLADPLPPNEVADTAKSIGSWTWHNYTGTAGGYHVGAASKLIEPHEDETPTFKRAVGALYIHAKRATKTAQVVAACKAQIEAEGKPVTASEVSRRIGMTRKTVAKYLHAEGKPEAVRKAEITAAGVRIIVPSDKPKDHAKSASGGVSNMAPSETLAVAHPKGQSKKKAAASIDDASSLAKEIERLEAEHTSRMSTYRAALAECAGIPRELATEGADLRRLAGSIYDLRRRLEFMLSAEQCEPLAAQNEKAGWLVAIKQHARQPAFGVSVS